jgi:predicted phage baseplate assembly protein
MNANRPGLGAISYRIGTFSSFFEAMKARLSSADYPGLAALRTRDSSDWSIALLDAWAAVADVLTFYQERIANEGYVRTVTERLSILELGRTVGYQLRPGVAATAYLAYTMDPTADVTVPPGTRTQSTPPQGQLPQPFETGDALHARGDWNTLGVRTVAPQTIDLKSLPNDLPLSLVFTGANLNLNPDDVLLIVDASSGASEAPALVRVTAATPQAAPGQTTLSQTNVTIDALHPAASGGASGAAASGAGSSGSAGSGGANSGPGSGAAPARSVSAPEASATLSQVLTGYQSVEAGLTKPPASHPPNALRLPQSIPNAFGANADAVVKALTVLQPALESTLVPALAQAVASTPVSVAVYAFRVNALPFGANAPKHLIGFREERDPQEREALKNVAEYREWRLAADEDENVLYLDRSYPALSAGADSYVAIVQEQGVTAARGQPAIAQPAIATIANIDKIGRAEYGISGTTSKLTLATDWYTLANADPLITFLRKSQVYAQSEQLQLAGVPVSGPIAGAVIALDDVYDGLDAGRWLIVSGTRTDVPGVAAAELVMLSTAAHSLDPDLPGDTLHTTLTLASPLAYQYDPPSVQIYGNVVRATHGETRTEVLGGGDGGGALQQFTLKSKPLTYVPVPTASGVQTTLQVSVNGIPWTENDDFDALGPSGRAFVTRTDNAGNTTVMFGDGIHGARLPTGTENVSATYRVGIGRAGNVDAGLLTLLASRPLGVRSVTNPLPATGGADPESITQGQSNVPLAAAALDRIVTAADYAAVARTFAGVAKAVAAIFPGASPIAQVTIAADGDEDLNAASPLVQNLESTLAAQGSAQIDVGVQPRDLIVLVLSANVALESGYRWENVSPAISAALLATFGFARRALAQDVYLTEIVAAITAVDGVASVDVTVFDGFSESDAVAKLSSAFANPSGLPNASVTASAPQLGSDGTISPAQLAIFKPELPQAIILQESGG